MYIKKCVHVDVCAYFFYKKKNTVVLCVFYTLFVY